MKVATNTTFAVRVAFNHLLPPRPPTLPGMCIAVSRAALAPVVLPGRGAFTAGLAAAG